MSKLIPKVNNVQSENIKIIDCTNKLNSIIDIKQKIINIIDYSKSERYIIGNLLQENGDYLLQENGDKILI